MNDESPDWRWPVEVKGHKIVRSDEYLPDDLVLQCVECDTQHAVGNLTFTLVEEALRVYSQMGQCGQQQRENRE